MTNIISRSMSTITVTQTEGHEEKHALLDEEKKVLNEPVSDVQVIPYLLRRRREGIQAVQGVVKFATEVGRSFDELLRDASKVLSEDDLQELIKVRTEFDTFIVSVRKFATSTTGRLRRLRRSDANVAQLIAHLKLGVEEERSAELSEKASELSERVTRLLSKVERAAGQASSVWRKIANISTAIAVAGAIIVLTGGVAAIPATAFVFPHAVLAAGLVAATSGAMMSVVAAAYAGKDRKEIVQFLKSMQAKLNSLRLRLADLEANLGNAKSLEPAWIDEIDEILKDLDAIKQLTGAE